MFSSLKMFITCKKKVVACFVTLRVESFAGRNFRDFRDFCPFSRKFLPGKKVTSKFAKVFFAKSQVFLKVAKVFSTTKILK